MTSIGRYSFEEYLQVVESFHGFAAPGVIVGGFMVDLAIHRMPEGILFDAICETATCLPDAIQLLTPCTLGNGWLKVLNLGRFALSLYDKHSGEGVRVFLDAERLKSRPEINSWLFKLKTKAEQDYDRLIAEIRDAGWDLCGVQPVRVHPKYLHKESKGAIATCARCGEPYPIRDGAVCLACGGSSPYASVPGPGDPAENDHQLKAAPVCEAMEKSAFHDMTPTAPEESKAG